MIVKNYTWGNVGKCWGCKRHKDGDILLINIGKAELALPYCSVMDRYMTTVYDKECKSWQSKAEGR